ncbi:MAG: hypothetical protein AB1351_10080 [Thermoproteota archaeon]
MHRRKDPLLDQVPEYGLEALVGTIDDRKELLKALKAASKRCSTFKRLT